MSERTRHWWLFVGSAGLVFLMLALESSNQLSWTNLERLALILGSISIVPVIGEAARITPRNRLVLAWNYAVGNLEGLESACRNYAELMRFRSENRHADFPNSKERYLSLREWLQASDKFAELRGVVRPERLDAWLAECPNYATDEEVDRIVAHVADITERCKQKLACVGLIERQLDHTTFEEIAVFFSPILLGASLAILMGKSLFS